MTDEVTESIADALTQAMAEAESEPETEEAVAVSEEAAEEVVEEEVEETELEAAEEDDDGEEPATAFQAPEHWSSDEREQFSSLPPEAQQVLLDKDKQWQKGYQEKAQTISAITDAIKPWEQSLAQRGLTPEQAIRSLFAAQHALDTDAVGGILQIAQNYGVVDQLRDKFAPVTDDDELIDPQFKALQQEIRDLKGQITETKQGFQQQQNQTVQQQIDSFQNAKDANGEPLHPHFEAAMPMILASVQSGDTLETAYEKAKWTVPAYRESLEKQEVQKTEAEKAKKVKQAKRAARGVKTNGKADPEEGVEAMSLHDTLNEAFRQHSS
jgi:hypothetical protein